MNERTVEAKRIERFEWNTDAEAMAVYVGGFAGFLGGIGVVLASEQPLNFSIVPEIYGPAGATALAATGVVSCVRWFRRRHRLKGPDRLYAEEVNAIVAEEFQNGYEVFVNWLGRQIKKTD